jgi:ELWxxDGT repeat protein
LVKDINPGIASSGPSTITVFNGKAYFQVNDGVHGHEPWVTDGTEAGTHLLADINPGTPGSEAREFFEHAGKLFFSATDGILGHELWVTDGTEAGTHLLADINPGPNGSAPTGFFELGDELLFTATDGSTGLELWKTDGTQTGAILVKDINPGAANGFDRFNGNDRQLFAEAGGNVFFLANSGATGFELWKTDGTEAGTMLVKDINPGPASAAPSLQPLHSFEGKVYFAADDGVHGVELWASDGTEAGTALVKDINSAGNSLSGELPYFSYTEEVFFDATTLGHEFFFVARSQENGAEVWKSDGTTLGTQLVKDINPGAYDAFSWETNSLFTFYFTHQSLFVASGGALYFTPVEPNFDRELWRTDGTESGTYRVADINPFVHPHGVASGSNPSYLTDINGTLYFAAATPQYGNEPWIYAPFANQSPTTAGPISSITNEDDIPYIIDLLSGASDPDPGDVLSVTNVVITGDASGLTLDGNSLHVDPAAYNHFAVGESVVVEVDYVIVDGQGGSLAQSATITINGQNDAPLATNDQVIVPQGSSENAIAVLANDADPDTSDTLLIQSVSATARNATAVISPDQTSILYTPRTPTSTGIDTFTYTVIDPWGAPATATITVTILANTVVVEPIGLEAEVLAQQSTPEEPLDVVVNVNPLSYDDVIAAVNSLPPVAEGGQTVFVTLAVSDGTYAGATISPPPGVVVIINGYGGSITIVGASPALTISSGTVIIQDGVLLTNTTDAPTIMVTGGHLIVRNSTIEESTNFARAGIEITGGTADLGTTDSPGGNTFIVHGEGEFIVNTSGNDVSAVGNVFVSNNAGNDLPLISAIGDQQYTQTELTVQIEALDPDNDPLGYSVAFASKSGGGAVNDPTDFSIDALGLFHWTPGAGQLGQYTFEALVSDGTQQISQQFTITTLGVVDGVLTIVGTSGIDRITVKPTQGNIDLLSVTIHGKDFNFKLKPGNNPDNPYNDVQRVLIHALGGDDHVDIHNRLLVDTEIHGGAGDDRLKGGDGHDVIFGGMGDDLLNGADGNDFLIGGDGRDKLHGQKGNDILLAGRFAENFDTRFANLRSISAAWAAGFANNDLTDDNEDDELLDELAGDLLSGGQGADWFIVSSGDQTDFNVKKNKDGDLLTIL